MNPQALFWFQQLVNMGYPPQQAMQFAQQMASLSGGAGSGSPGSSGAAPQNDLQSQIANLLGTSAGIQGLQGPTGMEKNIANIAMNPALLNQRINQFTRPLSQNLINSVTRNANAGIAERGLATAPGMSQQITAEALAPYEQSNQQQGEELALQSFEPVQHYAEGVGTNMAGEQANLAYLLGQLGNI